MNILLSSDDNYASHLGVVMYSLMIHNSKAEKLNFFVVCNGVSTDNLSKLKSLVQHFINSNLFLIPFDSYVKDLHLDMSWPISLSAYARLFAAELLPTEIKRVLYLDCDMVVNADLAELWNFDLEGNSIAAVQDQMFPSIKKSIGIPPQIPYFNSGLLLIDLSKWRELDFGKRCFDFISKYNGRVIHHDQGVLNGLFWGRWTRLPLRYNVMTIHFFLNQKLIRKFFKDYSPFYDEVEIELAKSNPVILHYTPSYTSHPWEEHCRHPFRNLYFFYLNYTEWAGAPLSKDTRSWYQRLINWRYRSIPF